MPGQMPMKFYIDGHEQAMASWPHPRQMEFVINQSKHHKHRPELALLLHALQYNPAHASELAMNPSIDWPLFFSLVCRHRVWHPVYKALNPSRDKQSPHAILTRLANHCQRDQRRILITAGETIRIARAFQHAAIAHCFVKGTLLNVLVYGGLNTRPCKDIDVWVDTNNYAQAMAALIALGYQQTLPNYALEGFKEAYYLSHKHDLAFFHPTQRVTVELHFRLSYFGIDFFPFQTVPLVPIHLMNVPIPAPQDDYHLLYLMIHGSIHAWVRLRWLHDIVLFIDSNRCDLNRIWNLAASLKCQHIVEQTLILVKTLFPTNHPTFAPYLLPSPSQRAMQLAALAQQFINSDYEMTDGLRNLNMFVKYRVYLAKLAVRGQKGHALWGDLFKIDMLFPYVTFPRSCSFLYYLAYPLWVIRFIWKAIAHHIGALH